MSKPRLLERSIAAAHRARSLESRAGGILSFGVVCALGIGLLAWYYGVALERPARISAAAGAPEASSTRAEMLLPPLPPLAQLTAHDPTGSRSGPVISNPEESESGHIPTSTPVSSLAAPDLARPMSWVPGTQPPSSSRTTLRALGEPRARPTHRRALERRLSGPVFAAQSAASGSPAAGPGGGAEPASMAQREQLPSLALLSGSPAASQGSSDAPSSDVTPQLAQLLAPTPTPAASARVLPTRTLLLPKGTFIDCTLETAIDSTLPGMTTCVTATDTFGADGKVVLLERGSKLVGETRGQVRQGGARVFVLWTEARTPSGVVIPLASPGTDELGRAGVPGTVNRHFFARFGAALLISIIDAGAQAAAQRGGGAVIYGPGASEDVTTEVLRQTLRIPPTIIEPQGARIQVLVARDIDFRSVYELHIANRGR